TWGRHSGGEPAFLPASPAQKARSEAGLPADCRPHVAIKSLRPAEKSNRNLILKMQLQRELQNARIARRCDPSESGRAQIPARGVEIGVVDHVEAFGARL